MPRNHAHACVTIRITSREQLLTISGLNWRGPIPSTDDVSSTIFIDHLFIHSKNTLTHPVLGQTFWMDSNLAGQI